MFPGVEFDFGGGQRLLVPPLSCGALELLQDRLNELPTLAATDTQAVRTVVDAAHAALRRNYPDATRDEVAELVDVANLGDVYECLMDVGGLRRRAQQEAREAAAGNPAAPAAAVVPAAAGAPSSPA
jgi:hypothetical protein